MKAAWRVHFSTGYDLSDNDLYRVRELLEEAIRPVADRYLADLTIAADYSVPGPPILPPLTRCDTEP